MLAAFIQSEVKTFNEEKIQQSFTKYMDTIHPQKIYLHLDKDLYFAKERIYFASYLLDACTYKPDTTEAHIYIELINPYKQLSQIVRVKQEKGIGKGTLYLSDTLPEGLYQIRAYTNRMKNYGPEFYFKKNLVITNIFYKKILSPKQAKKNRLVTSEIEKEKNEYGINFFPEGGKLLVGKPGRVAFKIENKFGQGTNAIVEIINNKNRKVAEVVAEHKGMGSFWLTPQKGEIYYARISSIKGNNKKYLLPTAQENTVKLSIADFADKIKIQLVSNKSVSADRSANEFVLIGQVRSKIYYSNALNLIDHDTLKYIDKDLFPPGIIYFTLFNNRLQPVSERLFFIRPDSDNSLSIDLKPNQDSIDVKIAKVRELNDLTSYNVAMSAVLMNYDYPLPTENILTDLFLTSDLPGSIEEPIYYLQSTDTNIVKHTDLLMLTNSWKRYFWVDILNGNFPKQKYEPEKGITVKGRITREIIELPYKDANLTLSIMNRYNDEFTTISGKMGEFRFDNLNYNDTIDVKITARKTEGGKNLIIHLNESPIDKIVDFSGNFLLTTQTEITKKQYRHITNQIARENRNRREKELDSIFSSSIYGRPDNVIWGDEIPAGASNLLEVIQGRVPGVMVTGDRILIRGVNTLLASTDPLLLVDGVPTDISVLKNIPPIQVDRIEFLKGPSTAIYGSRGGNGVIAIYTKQGFNQKKGEIRFSMLGYSKPGKFKPPDGKLVSQRIQNKTLPLTIYWNPGIKITKENEFRKTLPFADTDSKILIIIEGIDQKGHPIAKYATIIR